MGRDFQITNKNEQYPCGITDDFISYCDDFYDDEIAGYHKNNYEQMDLSYLFRKTAATPFRGKTYKTVKSNKYLSKYSDREMFRETKTKSEVDREYWYVESMYGKERANLIKLYCEYFISSIIKDYSHKYLFRVTPSVRPQLIIEVSNLYQSRFYARNKYLEFNEGILLNGITFEHCLYESNIRTLSNLNLRLNKFRSLMSLEKQKLLSTVIKNKNNLMSISKGIEFADTNKDIVSIRQSYGLHYGVNCKNCSHFYKRDGNCLYYSGIPAIGFCFGFELSPLVNIKTNEMQETEYEDLCEEISLLKNEIKKYESTLSYSWHMLKKTDPNWRVSIQKQISTEITNEDIFLMYGGVSVFLTNYFKAVLNGSE